MNYATRELAIELYEASGKTWFTNNAITDRNNVIVDPKLDLDYLLQKLPPTIDGYYLGIEVTKDGRWQADYITADYTPDRPIKLVETRDNTPKDAVCRLGTELFKRGYLKALKEGDE